MLIRRLLTCCLTLLICSISQAEDPPAKLPEKAGSHAKPKLDADKAKGILSKADTALKKIKTVKYYLRSHRIDVPESAASKMYGSLIMSGWNDPTQTPERFRYEVTSQPGGSSETATIIAGSDQEQFWALNMRDKKAYTGDQIATIGPYQVLVTYFQVREFMVADPLGDELRGRVIEFMGETDVGGESCYKIRVSYADSGQSATWYFSTKDYLPRRVDRVLINPAGEKTTRASFISDIVVDPELPEDVFKLVIPSDFIKPSGTWP